VALAADVGEVGFDDEVAVALVEHEAVRAAGVVRNAAAVPHDHETMVAGGRRHGVPPHGGAAELVGHLLVVAQGEHEAVGVARGLGPERPRTARAPVAEVRVGPLVDVPALHPLAVVLGDGDGEVGVGEPQEPPRVTPKEAPGEAVQQLAREVGAQHAPHEHHAGER
jgi:hypothetical protein